MWLLILHERWFFWTSSNNDNSFFWRCCFQHALPKQACTIFQTCHMKKEKESAKRNRYSSSNSDNRVKASCCILCNLKYFSFPQTFVAFLKIFCFTSNFFFPSIFIFLASKYIFLKRKVFIEEISEIFKKARRFSMDWPKTSKMIAYNRTCEEKSVVWHLGAYSYRIKRFLKIYWFEYVFKPKAKVSLRYYIVKYFLEEKSRFDFHAKDLHARSNHITKLACSLTVKCLQVWAYPQQRKDSLIHIYLRLTYKWNVFDVSWLSTVKHISRVLWLGVRMVNFCHVVSHCNFRVDNMKIVH